LIVKDRRAAEGGRNRIPLGSGLAEIVNLADLGHRAVAVEHGGAARVDHLAPNATLVERLVHLELELEPKRVPGNEEATAGRAGMAGDRVGDHDTSLRLDNNFDGSCRVRLVCRQHDGNFPGKQAVAERPDRFTRPSNGHDLAGLEHYDAIADLAHHVRGMRHENDRPALALELVHAFHAFLLESFVPYGEHLVDEQHVRLDVDGNRKPETDYMPDE